MRTHVYVDGFNLYYGCVKGTPYRWLDLNALCRAMIRPQNQILAIHYYSALVSGRPSDPDQPVRQQTYWRALRTIPHLTITEGQFLSHPVAMFVPNPAPGCPSFVTVIKTEEKGSDVNLASHLLRDASGDAYDVAVLISNDSDLAEPLRIARQEFGKIILLLHPHQHATHKLAQYANFVKPIRASFLAAAQFPPTLTDANGSFHKPPAW